MTERACGDDPFLDENGVAKTVYGVSILTNSPHLAELAPRVGLDTVWIDLEHGPASYETVERQCVAVEAGGGIPTVRVPNKNREHVLRALECGARIVVVPMINTASDAREVVEYGKYRPVGRRGYSSRSRGNRFGLAGPAAEFEISNRRTHLIAQLETPEAVQQVEEICAVDGLGGILIGPGDLSQELGRTAQFTDPELIEMATHCIRTAKRMGKHGGILAAPGPLVDAALEAGCDLMYVGGDIQDLAKVWMELVDTLKR